MNPSAGMLDHFPLELYIIAQDHMALPEGRPQLQLQIVGHSGA